MRKSDCLNSFSINYQVKNLKENNAMHLRQTVLVQIVHSEILYLEHSGLFVLLVFCVLSTLSIITDTIFT